MQGTEADANNSLPRVTVDSDGASRPSRGVQRAADAASAVTRALSEAGYEPHHLSVTTSQTGELVVIARIEERPRLVHALAGKTPRSPRSAMLTRLAIGLTLGILLGFLGLPRLDLPTMSLPASAPAATAPPALLTASGPEILSIKDLAEPTPPTDVELVPTPVMQFAPAPLITPAPLVTPEPAPTPLPVPTPTAVVAQRPNSAIFSGSLASAIAGWPNDPRGTAWFGPGGYRLFARDSGQFVATGIPLKQPIGDVKISAQFRKAGGPTGGGYGLILRDQAQPGERDGRNQGGEYLVAEVGDRGDIGIWQRDEAHWIDIVPWQHSNAVQADQAANTIVVTTRGPSLMLEVNGQVVAGVLYDRLPSSGGVGVFVGGDLNEVVLERLQIDNTD
jgi:hypothetical protein